MPDEPLSAAPGWLLLRNALGKQAVYRVIAVAQDVVDVEVVRAPGLPAGFRLKLHAADVRAMKAVTSPPAGPCEQRG